ncbi:MAG: hypothetical protein EBT15_12430 [Betaproteobacteria bacterium]|nr:hypothetical protein [Betaproteobacteria bacterium]
MSRALAPTIRLDAAALATTSPILPHQQAAWNWLQEQLTTGQVTEFAELFRASPAVKEPLLPVAANPLSGFPYFSQISSDGSDGVNGWRQCQTSSISMCLAYLKVKGIKDDTDYLQIVNRYGDTTSQDTHRLALKALGVRARFVKNCSASQLQAELRGGLPAALGYLHRGPVGAPSGGGHWLACYGFTSHGWIVNDPYGSCDLLSGGFTQQGGTSGKAQLYSYRNFNPRWLVDGPATGWAWLFS